MELLLLRGCRGFCIAIGCVVGGALAPGLHHGGDGGGGADAAAAAGPGLGDDDDDSGSVYCCYSPSFPPLASRSSSNCRLDCNHRVAVGGRRRPSVRIVFVLQVRSPTLLYVQNNSNRNLFLFILFQMQTLMPLILLLQATAAAAFSNNRSLQLTSHIIILCAIILCVAIIICQLRHHRCPDSAAHVGCSVWLPLAEDVAGVCEVFTNRNPLILSSQLGLQR